MAGSKYLTAPEGQPRNLTEAEISDLRADAYKTSAAMKQQLRLAALEAVAVAFREAVIALEATHHPLGPSDKEVATWRRVLDRYDALARLDPPTQESGT